jgi:RNA polymerase subunit RPABC4/transcription elongation factor Spt4
VSLSPAAPRNSRGLRAALHHHTLEHSRTFVCPVLDGTRSTSAWYGVMVLRPKVRGCADWRAAAQDHEITTPALGFVGFEGALIIYTDIQCLIDF